VDDRLISAKGCVRGFGISDIGAKFALINDRRIPDFPASNQPFYARHKLRSGLPELDLRAQPEIEVPPSGSLTV
jgi:hypothetical protein